MNCPPARMFEAMKWETVNFLEFLLKKIYNKTQTEPSGPLRCTLSSYTEQVLMYCIYSRFWQ